MKKYADTPLIRIAYLEQGEMGNPVVLLLHGWPDDATTWNKVMPLLVESGYRVIAPWLRGFGETKFNNKSIPRTGNFSMLALDAIALLDELGIAELSVVGHDWGANVANALSVGWPDRVKKMTMLSSPPRLGSVKTSPFKQAQLEWYQWFMATERGEEAVRKDPVGFSHFMWENWSPKGWFTEETFEKVSRSWLNPDFVDVTIHSYRANWGEAEPDKQSSELEEKVLATQTLSLPVLFLQGEEDGVTPPYVTEHVHKKFTGPFKRIVLPGVGHFPSREAPVKIAVHLIDFLRQ